MKKLNVGDTIFGGSNVHLIKKKIDKVTNEFAFSGFDKFKREYKNKFIQMLSSLSYESTLWRISTPELESLYDNQIYTNTLSNINWDRIPKEVKFKILIMLKKLE